MLALTLPEKSVFLQHKLKEQKDIKEMEVGGGNTACMELSSLLKRKFIVFE